MVAVIVKPNTESQDLSNWRLRYSAPAAAESIVVQNGGFPDDARQEQTDAQGKATL